MAGPNHGRGANNSGYIKRVQRKDGIRYEARLRNQWLGSFETRARAQRAIDDARRAPTNTEIIDAIKRGDYVVCRIPEGWTVPE